MTITNTDVVTRIACTGNSHVDFTIGVDFFENSDLEVWVRDQRTSTVTETKKTLTTDFTLLGTPATTVRFGTSPAASAGTNYANIIVVIRRVLRYEQTTDYASGDAFPADSHETALDKLAALTQQLKEITDRVFTLPHTYKNAAVSLNAPEPSAHGIMKWNAAADALVLDTDIADSTYKLKVTENEGEAGYLDSKLLPGTGLSKATTNDTVNEESITFSVNAAQTQITSVGALNAGSITSGFGTIDTGSDNITTSGQISAGTFAGAALDNNTSLGSATNKAPTQNACKAYVDSQTTSDATTSSKGIASFSDASFSVSSGAVSLKEGAVLDNPVIKGDEDASGSIVFQEDTSNGSHTATIKCPEALAGNAVVTLPGTTDTLVGKDTTDTLTNKRLTSPKLNEDVAVTATATELNIMDGVTASTSELNIMDGVTASTSEINIIDGVTASTSEINVLDGATAGTNVASKALVVDSNKKINELIQNYGEFKHQGSDPASATASQDVRLYAKDSKLYTKDNSGTVKELGAGGVGSIDTLFTIQAKSADAAYTAIGNGYVWSGAGSSLTNATLALETTDLDLIQSEKVFAYDSGGSGVRNWWYHEQEIQNGYGGKNMVLQLQYFTRNCADSNIFRFYARDAAKPIFTSDGSADAGTNQILGAASWDASLSTSSPDDRKAAAVGDRIVIIDTSNNIHYRYITAVSPDDRDEPGALTITYSGADIAPANSTVMLIGVMTDELDYLPANNMSAAGNNEAKLYKKQMSFPEGCRLFQFGFHVESTDADVELYYDDIALSANQFLQTSSQGQSEYYWTGYQGSLWSATGGATGDWNTALLESGPDTPAYGDSKLVRFSDATNQSVTVTRIYAKEKINLELGVMGAVDSGDTLAICDSSDNVLIREHQDPEAGADGLSIDVNLSLTLAKEDYVYVYCANMQDANGQMNIRATPQVNDVVLLNSQDEIFTDWVDFDPVWSQDGGSAGPVAPTSYVHRQLRWRRVGSNMEIDGYFNYDNAGTNGSSTYTLALPSGYTIAPGELYLNLSKNSSQFVGEGLFNNSTTMNIPCQVRAYSESYLFFTYGSSNVYVDGGVGFAAGNWRLSFRASVPIAGWTSTFNPVLSMPLVDIGADTEYYHLNYFTAAAEHSLYSASTPITNTISSLGTVNNTSAADGGFYFKASTRVKVDFNYWARLSTGSGYNALVKCTEAYWNTGYSFDESYWDNLRLAVVEEETGYVRGVSTSTILEPGEVIGIIRDDTDAPLVSGTPNWASGVSIVVERDRSHTNLAHIIKPAVCILEHVLSQGTNAGGSTQDSWQPRELNTIKGESWFLNSLSSNIFSLPKGQYKFKAQSIFYDTNDIRLRLYDTSNSKAVLYSMNNYQDPSEIAFGNVLLDGLFTLTTDTSFRLEYYCKNAKSVNGLGSSQNLTGVEEIYTRVVIEKLK